MGADLIPRSVAKKFMPDEIETALYGPTPAQRQAGVSRLSALGSFVAGRDTTGGTEPPGSEGGSVRGDVVDQPPTSRDLLEQPRTIVNTIPYGGEFMAQQPMMMGSPMVYSRVADIARQLASRGGIGGVATGVGVGGLIGSMFDGNGRPATIPQQVRAVTGMSFTRKTQMAYKNLAEMTGLQNAAACLGIPEQLFCQALIHRFPVRRRGISAAQLRTAKRVNRTVKQMHSELGLRTTTRRAPARRSASTVIQNS